MVHVFALKTDWFIVLSASVVIGQSTVITLVLVLPHSIENCFNYMLITTLNVFYSDFLFLPFHSQSQLWRRGVVLLFKFINEIIC